MLHYLHADDLNRFPALSKGMFRDRAEQFARRLGWAVRVNEMGEERDEYDDLAPLYVIWERADGSHGGSMRLLPTTGRTMVNDHFAHLNGGVAIESPDIWECTRFCLAPGSGREVSAALVLGAGELMATLGLRHYIGVFDRQMERIYRLHGLAPEILGRAAQGGEVVSLGRWSMDEAAFAPALRRVGVSRAASRGWIRRAELARGLLKSPLEPAGA